MRHSDGCEGGANWKVVAQLLRFKESFVRNSFPIKDWRETTKCQSQVLRAAKGGNYTESIVTIQNVDKDFFRLRIGRIALVLPRVRSPCILNQQEGRRGVPLHGDHRHPATW